MYALYYILCTHYKKYSQQNKRCQRQQSVQANYISEDYHKDQYQEYENQGFRQLYSRQN